jgi:hypothetical protein
MTPAELDKLIDKLRSEPVCSVETAAKAVGVGRTLAFETVRETGELAGIKVLRIGRKLVVPTRPILLALGYEAQGHACHGCAKADGCAEQ